jgi:transposase InsO family protein
MCQLSGLSRAAFYRHWERSAPKRSDTALRDQVQRAALANRFYGYRRITKHLRQEGWIVNAKRVRRLMHQDNLLCLRRRRFIPPTTDGRHNWRMWPNLIRGLETTALDQLWIADITYVRLGEEFVYVAVLLDAHSRRVVGWAVERHLGTSLALRALRMALDVRKPQAGMIHHSDRGVQYACEDYTSLLAQHGIRPSMSRPGNPYDNAKAESFMKTLKTEQVYGNRWRNLDELMADLTRFFEHTYNRERLHSAIGYQTPVSFEAALAAQAVA